jgi:mono/diheme cytochrome c family protein
MVLMALVCAVWAGDAERGKAIYGSNCVACHGRSGDGKGPAAQAMRPAPTDFTTTDWWKGKSDDQIATMIKRGTAGTPMVAFPKLSDDELDDLVAYMRKLAKESAR